MAKVRLTLEQEMVLREYREKSTRLFQELRAAVAASKELTHMQDNPDDEKVLMGGLFKYVDCMLKAFHPHM
ncbi:MAG: hypothetical protein ABSA33_06030 [Candidatus Micrarchaeaceae archaeon]|jgi:hypothetical protein